MPEYPPRLLPKSNYRFIPAESLGNNGLVLIRHIDSSQTLFYEGTNIIDPVCIHIQSGHLRDLSNNLLGVFHIEDAHLGIVKEYSNEFTAGWDGVSDCKAPEKHQFFIDNDRGYYFIPLDRILELSIPYSQDSTETYRFIARHTPTKCNFWHISIRVINNLEEEIGASNNIGERKRSVFGKQFVMPLSSKKSYNQTRLHTALYHQVPIQNQLQLKTNIACI